MCDGMLWAGKVRAGEAAGQDYYYYTCWVNVKGGEASREKLNRSPEVNTLQYYPHYTPT